MILPIWSQHTITIDASLDDTSHTLDVKQHVLFENTTGTPLDTLYFHDWANSFSTKKLYMNALRWWHWDFKI